MAFELKDARLQLRLAQKQGSALDDANRHLRAEVSDLRTAHALKAGGTAADSNDPSPSVAELRARKKVAGGTVDDTQAESISTSLAERLAEVRAENTELQTTLAARDCELE